MFYSMIHHNSLPVVIHLPGISLGREQKRESNSVFSKNECARFFLLFLGCMSCNIVQVKENNNEVILLSSKRIRLG